MFNIILNFISNIKWSPLKVSMLANIILGGVLYFVLNQETEIKTVTITRTHIIDVPSQIVQLPPINNPIPKVVKRPDVNNELLKKYDSVRDENKRFKMYIDAITERHYTEVFTKDNYTGTVNTKVRGEMLSQDLKIAVKKHQVEVTSTDEVDIPVKKRNDIFVGGETGLPFLREASDQRVYLKGNVLIKNKKDNMWSVGYDNNKHVWVGYYIKL